MFKRRILSVLVIVFIFISCNSINKLDSDCRGITRENYYPNNLVIVESNNITFGEMNQQISYDSLIEKFGKEFKSNKAMNYGQAYKQLHFSFKGNTISYFMRNDTCRLVFAQFKNEIAIGKFKGEGLSHQTNLKDFRIKEQESFCNSIYYEKEDRFVLHYVGTMEKEVYSIIFEKGKLTELRVSW